MPFYFLSIFGTWDPFSVKITLKVSIFDDKL